MVDIGSSRGPPAEVNPRELHRLLQCMLQQPYSSRVLAAAAAPASAGAAGSSNSSEAAADTAATALLASNHCRQLFELDYTLHGCLDNQSGGLCDTYPPHIFLPSRCHRRPEKAALAYPLDLNRLCRAASRARVRNRFPAPVLMFEGKLICRSSALSAWPEAYSKSALSAVSSWFTSGGRKPRSATIAASPPDQDDDAEDGDQLSPGRSGSFFDRTRGSDMAMLDCLSVKQIVDLTVEAKFYKYGFPLPLSSTEKIDKRDRYRDYKLCVIPYPGCEFFRVWAVGHGLAMSGVQFRWDSPAVNARLRFDDRLPAAAADIHWDAYTEWDLTRLTCNYLRLLLGYVVEFPDDGGLLLHCISGWDRTPMFVCLLRCLLWSEGLCHASLSPLQLLYLTLAYDWYLFGHQLPSRLRKDEYVLHFCFHFLHSVAAREDSQLSMLARYPHLKRRGDVDRAGRLRQLCETFFDAYAAAERQQAVAVSASAGPRGRFSVASRAP